MTKNARLAHNALRADITDGAADADEINNTDGTDLVDCANRIFGLNGASNKENSRIDESKDRYGFTDCAVCAKKSLERFWCYNWHTWH